LHQDFFFFSPLSWLSEITGLDSLEVCKLLVGDKELAKVCGFFSVCARDRESLCVFARVLGVFFLVCYCEIRAGTGQIVLFAFA
jgi:hypothetical protein